MKTVAVICGGKSQEHEVSCRSAYAVLCNIDREKYNTVKYGITRDGYWTEIEGPDENILNFLWYSNANKFGMTEFCKKAAEGAFDIIFPVLHGPNGEDGTIQGFFEMLGVPYVGCGVLASAVGMDKVATKMIVSSTDVPQCRYTYLTRFERNDDIAYGKLKETIANHIKYPCFIKPANAGSSVGVHKVCNETELDDSVDDALLYDTKIIIEESIIGREVECAILGNNIAEATIPGEVIPCNEFYDYDAKYNRGDSSVIRIPAEISENNKERIREYAKTVYKVLNCSGLSRVDFFCNNDTDTITFNEINTLPGFTVISMYSKLWGNMGISFTQLVNRLIALAEEKKAYDVRKY